MRLILSVGLLVTISCATYAQPPSSSEVRQSTPAFYDGAADRQRWETWFASLSGDFKSGAAYWTTQRSMSKPGSCRGPAGKNADEWVAGCLAAQGQLAHSDTRRRTEPEYKLGWNSTLAAMEPGEKTALAQPTSPAVPPISGFQPNPQGATFLKLMAAQDAHVYEVSGQSSMNWEPLIAARVTVDASTLFRDYNANEIAADLKYLNKTLAVNGRILGIRKNAFGSAYVELDSSSGSLTSVLANIASDSIDEAARYQKGQVVVLICTGRGLTIGSPVLSQCRSKKAVDEKSDHLIGLQIDNWLATGRLPSFVPNSPNFGVMLFAAYWIGSRLPSGSPCLSDLLNSNPDACTEAIMRQYRNPTALEKALPIFRADYMSASTTLHLPSDVAWGELFSKVKASMANTASDLLGKAR